MENFIKEAKASYEKFKDMTMKDVKEAHSKKNETIIRNSWTIDKFNRCLREYYFYCKFLFSVIILFFPNCNLNP